MAGLIGFYNLNNWWQNDLSENERSILETLFTPMTSNGVMKGMLTTGNQKWDESTFGFLSILLGWVNKIEYYDIAKKIIKIAMENIEKAKNEYEKHSFYGELVKIHYKNRDNDPHSLELAIQACKDQIKLGKYGNKMFPKSEGFKNLPEHIGYKQLCIIEEKKGNFEEVLKLATQAKNEGWSGDWDKRIEKIKNKIKK